MFGQQLSVRQAAVVPQEDGKDLQIMAKCKCCRHERGVYKVIGGRVCDKCLERLPKAIADTVKRSDLDLKVKRFTPEELIDLSQCVYPAVETPRIRCGNFGVCKNSIYLNGFQYPSRNIASIRNAFMPTAFGDGPNMAYGLVQIRLALLDPPVIITEPIMDEPVMAPVRIEGEKLESAPTPDLSFLIEAVQYCIDEGDYEFTMLEKSGFTIKGGRYVTHKEFYARTEAEIRKDSYARQRMRDILHGKDTEAGNSKKNDKSKSGSKRQEAGEDFVKAKRLFGVGYSYTEDELKKTRNELLKKYHPDNYQGDDAEKMTALINTYYELLHNML